MSYTTLITALSWLGRSDEALDAFQELDATPNACADLYAYNAVISALSVAGRMSEAEGFLQQAAKLAQEQEAAAPVEAFGAVIKVCSVPDVTPKYSLRYCWKESRVSGQSPAA